MGQDRYPVPGGPATHPQARPARTRGVRERAELLAATSGPARTGQGPELRMLRHVTPRPATGTKLGSPQARPARARARAATRATFSPVKPYSLNRTAPAAEEP